MEMRAVTAVMGGPGRGLAREMRGEERRSEGKGLEMCPDAHRRDCEGDIMMGALGGTELVRMWMGREP